MAAPKGNDNAAKGKVWADAVRKALVQGKSIDKVAAALVNKALEGDISAIKEIGDRLDGKPKQQIDVDANHTGNVTFTLSSDDANL